MSDTGNYNARVQVHSSAPTRLDLAGGTLDIWPLYLFHPGAQTVNVAIQLRAACSVTPSDDGRVWLVSEDTGQTLTAATCRALDTAGDNRLLAHMAVFFQVEGVRITTRAASPMGAGLAGSSALTIVVCAALARWQGVEYSPDQLLTLAMNLEARTLGIPTGVQDYRPALYGGVSAVELDAAGVTRVALEVDLLELERRLVLAYSGGLALFRHQQLGHHQAPHRGRRRARGPLRSDQGHRRDHPGRPAQERLGGARQTGDTGVARTAGAGARGDDARDRAPHDTSRGRRVRSQARCAGPAAAGASFS